MIFAIVRLGTIIAIPGIDVVGVKEAQQAAGIGTLYSMIAGGKFAVVNICNGYWAIYYIFHYNAVVDDCHTKIGANVKRGRRRTKKSTIL